MTRKKDSAKKLDWKAMMAGQEDFLRPLIQEVVEQVLEAEMDEALAAGMAGAFYRGDGPKRAELFR